MQPEKQTTLIISEKTDFEIDSVANAWEKRYGRVLRLGKFWQPPEIDSLHVKLYGNDTFCNVLAQILGLTLVSPEDDLILKVNKRWTGREIETVHIDNVIQFPIFIKPFIPKQFRAGIYNDKKTLLTECKGLESNTKILKSEIIKIVAEARAFVLNKQILDCSIYEGFAEVEDALLYVKRFCDDNELPVSCVVDFGKLQSGNWILIEANTSWGAGLNGCDAEKVIPAIFYATGKI